MVCLLSRRAFAFVRDLQNTSDSVKIRKYAYIFRQRLYWRTCASYYTESTERHVRTHPYTVRGVWAAGEGSRWAICHSGRPR